MSGMCTVFKDVCFTLPVTTHFLCPFHSAVYISVNCLQKMCHFNVSHKYKNTNCVM